MLVSGNSDGGATMSACLSMAKRKGHELTDYSSSLAIEMAQDELISMLAPTLEELAEYHKGCALRQGRVHLLAH